MAGGGAGAGNGSEVFNGGQAPDSTMSDNFGGNSPSTPTNPYAAEDRDAAINRAYQFSLGRAPEQGGYDYWTNAGNQRNWSPAQTASAINTAGAPERAGQQAEIYANLTRPTGNLISDIYQHSLGRAPDTEGANFWANAAQSQGWNAQQLAQAIGAAGEPERARTGYQSDMNPSNYSNQGNVGTRISSYETNPYVTDYANIFNPRAGQVTFDRATLSPQQQAQYLGDWAQNYSNTNRAATQAANLERKNTANAQWEKYLTEKAKAEAAAPDAINQAVEEKLNSMGYGQNSYSGDSNSGWYTGKAGGSVPGGLRSLKGKTKP